MTSSVSEFEGSPLVVKGSGPPPVLLLAGGSESPDGYFPGLGGLAAMTIAWDRPGTGHSPDQGTEGVRLAPSSAALHRLVTSLGTGPVVVLGHSLGGALGVQFLTDHPEDVAALVVLDPTVVNSPAGLKQATTSASVIGSLVRLPGGASAVGWLVRVTSKRQLAGPEVTPEAREAFVRMQALDAAQLARSVKHLVADGAALTARLSPARVPVVVVTAGNRKPGTAVHRAHKELATTLGARLEVSPGTDHIVHLQRPAKVRKLLDELVAQLTH